MPSVSGKQHRFFGFISTHPAAAKARGISTSVAREFLQADRGRHFRDTPTVKPAFMRGRRG